MGFVEAQTLESENRVYAEGCVCAHAVVHVGGGKGGYRRGDG